MAERSVGLPDSLQGSKANRVVVIGAGPAGARCAQLLGARGFAVTLAGAEPGLPYNRVALSLYLAGDLAEAGLITHQERQLDDHGITFRPGARVAAITPGTRSISIGDETLPYDALVIATGANPFMLPLPGAGLPGVVAYRTLTDVQQMLATAERGGGAVIIGGGLLGLEAAAGLARRGMAVTVLHVAGHVMERQLDTGAATLLVQRMARMGIAVLTTAHTASIEGDGGVERVVLKDGRVIPARMVVMAVGIRPEASLAREAGLEVGRGIKVDAQMRSSDPAIWAIGECAEFEGACCGLVAPAFAQAEVAAKSIAGEPACYTPVLDAAALKVAGAGVWSAGETEGPDPIVLHDGDAGQYRRFLVRDDRLVGAMLYGETADAPWYLDLIKSGRPVGAMRALLPFGPSFLEMAA